MSLTSPSAQTPDPSTKRRSGKAVWGPLIFLTLMMGALAYVSSAAGQKTLRRYLNPPDPATELKEMAKVAQQALPRAVGDQLQLLKLETGGLQVRHQVQFVGPVPAGSLRLMTQEEQQALQSNLCASIELKAMLKLGAEPWVEVRDSLNRHMALFQIPPGACQGH